MGLSVPIPIAGEKFGRSAQRTQRRLVGVLSPTPQKTNAPTKYQLENVQVFLCFTQTEIGKKFLGENILKYIGCKWGNGRE